jgi:hypothetical protein
MDWRPVVVAGVLQGAGLGMLMPASPRWRSVRSIRRFARQAAFVGVIGQFKVMMIVMLVVSPLVLLLCKPWPAA